MSGNLYNYYVPSYRESPEDVKAKRISNAYSLMTDILSSKPVPKSFPLSSDSAAASPDSKHRSKLRTILGHTAPASFHQQARRGRVRDLGEQSLKRSASEDRHSADAANRLSKKVQFSSYEGTHILYHSYIQTARMSLFLFSNVSHLAL